MPVLSLNQTVIALGIITGALALKYDDRALFDEHRENIPYPKGIPILGNLLKVLKNRERYFEYVAELYEDLNTLTFRSSSLTITSSICTIDPRNIEYILKTNFKNYSKTERFKDVFHDFLGDGIFNADGEGWRLQRRTASQIFHVRNFQTEFTGIFVDHINVMNGHIFDKAAKGTQVIDFHEVMLRFTMDTFVEIAFGVKLNSLLKKVEFADSFDAIQYYNFNALIMPIYAMKEKASSFVNFWCGKKSIDQHLKIVNDFAYSIIKERRKSQSESTGELQEGQLKTDLLVRFMNAKGPNGERYTDEELRDAMLNLIVAGRDTSAQTLSWFFYSIMQYPRIENKLIEEINEYITDEIELDSVKLYECIQKMKYSHAVLNEVLRLYPAVPGNGKQALADDTLPDGTPVRKGDEINFHPFCQGRNKTVWGKDAKEFKPERWLNEKEELIRVDPGRFPAFHAGPRTCLDQNMATLEILTVMSMLLRRYSFRKLTGHKVDFSYQVTLSMKNGMRVFVEKRVTT